jgi:ankyrin repeat protein
MSGRRRAVLAVCIAVAWLSACGRITRPPYGGAAELELIKATAAQDVAKVKQLLAAGADPNGMVEFERSHHAPWEYALTQMRARHPATIEIVKLMMQGGANPNAAWGGAYTELRGARMSEKLPIELVVLNPVPEIARALVAAGMDPRDADDALVLAIEQDETEIARILVDAGANVNATHIGTPPLLASIERRNYELMTYLEAHGAREKP